MREKVNGFLIVRKSLDKSVPYGDISRVRDKEYRGVERMHLEDVLDDYYSKELPSEIRQIVQEENEQSNEKPFMHYIRDYTNALKVLEYVDKKNNLNELIGISSDAISKLKGSIEIDSNKIVWMGYDIMPFGGSSLILNGLFFKPEIFNKWIPAVNQYGLFPTKDRVQEYIEDYIKYAKDNVVEPYDLTHLGFDAIKVGRIL